MTSIHVPELTAESLATTTRLDGDVIHLALRGNADLKVRRQLGEMLGQIHLEACRLGVSRVVVDMRDLQFMSSSCLSCFVTWLGELCELPRSQRIKVRFLSNPDILWQRRSLHALRSFALTIVSIES